jgi:predicted amidophosphoribosyltransferase
MPEAGEHEFPAAIRYAGAGRRLLLGLKYANGRGVARPLAARIAAMVAASGDEIDIVTWAPTSARRARRRGYDQAELIARAVAAELGVPCRRLLRRVDRSGPQTGKSRVQRAVGPQFMARKLRRRQVVLVIDDVITTAATLRSASDALRRAGSPHVVAIAAAATPSSERRRLARPVGLLR